MKNLVMIAALLLLAACSQIRLPGQGTDGVGGVGVDTLEFLRETRIQDKGTNVYTFAAGTRFPLNRGNLFDRAFCGSTQYNVERKPKNVCLGVEGATALVLSPSVASQKIRRPQPSGTFRVIKAGT